MIAADFVRILLSAYTILCALLYQANFIDKAFVQRQLDFLNKTIGHAVMCMRRG